MDLVGKCCGNAKMSSMKIKHKGVYSKICFNTSKTEYLKTIVS